MQQIVYGGRKTVALGERVKNRKNDRRQTGNGRKREKQKQQQ